MSGERFTLDTNVLVYSLDVNADYRRERAERIIDQARRCDCWLTLQSVSEFYVAVTRKRLVRQSEASAQAYDWLEMFSTVAPSANAIRAAITSTGEALPYAVLTLLSED